MKLDTNFKRIRAAFQGLLDSFFPKKRPMTVRDIEIYGFEFFDGCSDTGNVTYTKGPIFVEFSPDGEFRSAEISLFGQTDDLRVNSAFELYMLTQSLPESMMELANTECSCRCSDFETKSDSDSNTVCSECWDRLHEDYIDQKVKYKELKIKKQLAENMSDYLKQMKLGNIRVEELRGITDNIASEAQDEMEKLDYYEHLRSHE